MYIADDCHRCADVDDIALLHEQFLCLSAYSLDDRICQKLFLIQARDTFVQVYRSGQAGHIEDERADPKEQSTLAYIPSQGPSNSGGIINR